MRIAPRLLVATPQWHVVLSYSGLTAGPHVIEVRPPHQKNASSTGYAVVVDAFAGYVDLLPQ